MGRKKNQTERFLALRNSRLKNSSKNRAVPRRRYEGQTDCLKKKVTFPLLEGEKGLGKAI